MEPMLAELLAETSDEMPLVDSPSITLEAVELEPPALEIETEADVPPIQAPKLDTEPAVDIAAYSARAELAPGVVTTVIVLLEIGPDGAVTAAQVLRSTAGEAADAAALDYARATRWTPGRIDGEPRAMQASLAVILGERG
jgi:TonB family protein